MTWSNKWPFPFTGLLRDVQDWDTLAELWRACRERAWVLGREFFPGGSATHDGEDRPTSYSLGSNYTGRIDAMVRNADGTYTLTDGSKDWQPTSGFCGGTSRWINWSCSNAPWVPAFYDCVIEVGELDPWLVVRCRIVANTLTTLKLAGQPIDDAITAKALPPFPAWSGARYVIQRQSTANHPALHWHERWPAWPNCKEHAIGFVVDTDGRSLIGDGATLPPGAMHGKELMTRAGGKLVRIPLDTNTPDGLIVFARPQFPPPDVGAKYAVIDAGGRWRYPEPPFEHDWWPLAARFRPSLCGPLTWYGGFRRGFSSAHLSSPEVWSRYPDGVLRQTPVAAMQVNVLQDDPNNPGFCQSAFLDAMDVDVWSDPEDECTLPEFPHAPEFYFTLRGLQVWTESNADGFIEPKSYDNLSAIPNFVTATWFKSFGCNAYTAVISLATTAGTPHVNFSPINLPAGSIDSEIFGQGGGQLVHYAILDDDGLPIARGYSSAPAAYNGTYGLLSGKLVNAGRIDLRGPTAEEQQFGTYPPADVSDWVGKRIVFSLGWDRFVPREVLSIYEATAFIRQGVDQMYPGFYVTRPASTRYAEYDVLGRITETGTPLLRHGDLVRYRGANWNDPTTADTGAEDYDTVYRDRLNAYAQAPASGKVEEWGFYYVRDSAQTWATKHRAESGTATGGSATTLTDTTKSGNPFWAGGDGRWTNFILKVTKQSTGVTWRVPITSTAGTTLGFAAVPGFTVAAGDTYEIVEYLVLNAKKGRTLRIFDEGGVLHEVTITHSDADTLFFARQSFRVPQGTSFEIFEWQPGVVLKWDGVAQKFVKPTGADPRGASLQPPAQFHDDPRENLPSIVRRFGRYHKGDYPTYRLFNQLYNGINNLVWTRGTGNLYPRQVDDFPDPNGNLRSGGATGPGDADWEQLKADCETQYFASPGTEETVILPYTQVTLGWTGFRGASANAHHAWARTNPVPTVRIKHSTAVHVYTGLPDDIDQDTQAPDTWVFNPLGFNVYFRRWGLISSSPSTFNDTDTVQIGNSDNFPGAGGWPRTPAADPDQARAGWAVIQDANGNFMIVIHKWDVAGGMNYVAGNPPTQIAGAGLSGMFPLDL